MFIFLCQTRRQAIHNLKLKTSCLENEELIQELHVSDWSETLRTKLAAAHTKAIDLLHSVETETHWNAKKVVCILLTTACTPVARLWPEALKRVGPGYHRYKHTTTGVASGEECTWFRIRIEVEWIMV